MQKQQTTIPGTRAKNYVKLVEQACTKVTGFEQLYKDLERSINVSGHTKSTLSNYGRHLAHLALHYHCLPTELDQDQVLDYLHLVKSKGSPSATFFKFTVYGMRYACKVRGLEYQQFSLPKLDRAEKLPVVLNDQEMRSMLKVCTLLKHKILLATIYGCGLRCAEVRQVAVADVDLVRGMLHVKNGKGDKQRYLPLGDMLIRGIAKYLEAVRPHQWLFEGVDGACMSQRGTQWVVTNAKKKAGILKDVTTHTLRHTYATHLLEQGLDIVTIQDLLGHESIKTTMIYLHIAKIPAKTAFSPLDNIYRKA